MAQLLGQVAEGTLVKLNESGKPIEFYVAKQNYESGLNGSGRVLLVRKDCYDQRQWNSSNVNTWASSTLLSWLNSAYKSLLDPWVQEAIGTTTYYYTIGNGNQTVTTRSDPIFQLSATELGKISSDSVRFNIEGTVVPIASILQVAYLNGSPVYQNTRSPNITNTGNIIFLTPTGAFSRGACTNLNGSRPCFTLSNSLYVWDDGTVSQIVPPPSNFITPSIAMQGSNITISWDSFDIFESYIVQRKVDGGSWTQVYSGSSTSFTDTAGSWTTVQYQVCGVFDGTNGAFATSTTINIIPASTLVIIGEDSNLGTITNDVKYSVASDTGNSISLTRFVNGIQIASLTVESGFSYSIPVLDLPSGNGTIVITATVQSDDGLVTQKRTWQYTKTPIDFPNDGAVGVLSQGGQNTFPVTAAEAVRVSPAWGGSLDKALDFIRGPGSIVQSYPIASGQTVTAGQVVDVVDVPSAQTVALSTLEEGSIIYLNESGSPVEFYVAKHDYESELNGVGRTLVVRNGGYGQQQWNSSNVNTYAESTVDNWLNSTYKALLDSDVQSSLGTTFYYTPGNDNFSLSTLKRDVFILSICEILSKYPSNLINKEGSLLGISSVLVEKGDQLTRTSQINTNNSICYVASNFTYSFATADRIGNVCPCFTLPSDFKVPKQEFSKVITTSGTPSQAIALQGGSAGDTIPVIFSGVAQLSGVTQGHQISSTGVQGYGALDGWLSVTPYWAPKKVVYGSYTGTGSYGSSNPCSIVYDGNPEFIWMYAYRNNENLATSARHTYDIARPDDWSNSYKQYFGFPDGNSQPSTFGKKVGNTLYWYNTRNAGSQSNTSGVTYFYAIFY